MTLAPGSMCIHIFYVFWPLSLDTSFTFTSNADCGATVDPVGLIDSVDGIDDVSGRVFSILHTRYDFRWFSLFRLTSTGADVCWEAVKRRQREVPLFAAFSRSNERGSVNREQWSGSPEKTLRHLIGTVVETIVYLHVVQWLLSSYTKSSCSKGLYVVLRWSKEPIEKWRLLTCGYS